MTTRSIVFIVLLATFALPAQAQQLTKAEIEQAVAAGARSNPNDIGVVMTARPTFKERLALAAIDTFGGGAEFWTGFVMAVYTPTSWIQMASSRASASFERLGNVNGEMAKPVLRVFLKPNARSRAVIRSVDERNVLKPMLSRPCTKIVQFGDEVSQDCVELQFDLGALRDIQDSKGEFLVTVMVTGMDSSDGAAREVEMRRDFKVKRKHLDDLPGLR